MTKCVMAQSCGRFDFKFSAGKTAAFRARGLAESLGEPLHVYGSRFAFRQVRCSGRESRCLARDPQSFAAADAAASFPSTLEVSVLSEQGFAKPVLEVCAVTRRQYQRKLVGGNLDLCEQRPFGSMDVFAQHDNLIHPGDHRRRRETAGLRGGGEIDAERRTRG